MKYPIDLTQIKEYNTRQWKVNPRKAALIIIEMQKVFLKDMGIISDLQMANIHRIISVAEAAGTKIVYVRHNDSSEISRTMIDWWNGDKIAKDSDGWQIIDEFNTHGKIIIDKNQYSAFFKTDLDEKLKEVGIEDVIITGVMTNCCCETTARDAFMHGYRVFFINDATATVNEELHLATLKNMAFGFAIVQDTQGLVNDILERNI